jgi:hypothetical protein
MVAALALFTPQTRAAPTEAALGPEPPSREVLDARLKEILARPEYRQALSEGAYDPRTVLEWLWLWVRNLLRRLAGLHETNYGAFLVAVIAGVAALVPLLAHITYTLIRFARRGPRKPATAEGPASAPRPLSALDLMRQAEERAARGDHRGAVRSLYLALLRHLQVRGLLPRTSSQTNWENLAHLSSAPRLLPLVEPFTRTFDEKWYGGRSADSEDVARCRGWLQAVLREVEAP